MALDTCRSTETASFVLGIVYHRWLAGELELEAVVRTGATHVTDFIRVSPLADWQRFHCLLSIASFPKIQTSESTMMAVSCQAVSATMPTIGSHLSLNFSPLLESTIWCRVCGAGCARNSNVAGAKVLHHQGT
jgi:hypothetical protein